MHFRKTAVILRKKGVNPGHEDGVLGGRKHGSPLNNSTAALLNRRTGRRSKPFSFEAVGDISVFPSRAPEPKELMNKQVSRSIFHYKTRRIRTVFSNDNAIRQILIYVY